MSDKKNYTISTNRYSLTIGWLYPELMSTYGDRGNIIVLQKRCEWRGIDVKVHRLNIGFDHELLATCNLLFMGGAQDLQQKIVSEDLKKKSGELKRMIDDGIPGLYICGAYQFLGKYYKEADGTIIDGLGIFDLYTENPGENVERLIGNMVIEWCHPEPFDFSQDKLREGSQKNHERDSSAMPQNDKRKILVGFENHGGRTYLGKGVEPLGKVVVGFGNNGSDKTEGAIYKNSFCSYMHGPILPKNPHFADYLIKLALEKKYLPANATHEALQAGGEKIELKKLDDTLELQAHEAILKKIK